MGYMGGYREHFSLHNATTQPLAAHIKESLIDFQDPLDIEITSAAIQELRTDELHRHIPEIHITNKFGHYNIQATPAGLELLNKDSCAIEYVLSHITNQQHNHYQLHELQPDLLTDKPALREVVDAYKTVVDAITHKHYFGTLSADRFEQQVFQPRITARKRLLEILVATNNDTQLSQAARKQSREYTHALAYNPHQDKNALSALALDAYIALNDVFTSEMSASKRLDALVELTTIHHLAIDFADTYRDDQIRTQQNQSPVTYNQEYTNQLLETIATYNDINGNN